MKKLDAIGNSLAGAHVVEENLGNDNRSLLSNILNHIDASYRTDIANEENAEVIKEAHDHIVLATGSRPFVPPFEGADLPGVSSFQAIDDVWEVCSQLEIRMQETVENIRDPWKQAEAPADVYQYQDPQQLEEVAEVNNNG